MIRMRSLLALALIGLMTSAAWAEKYALTGKNTKVEFVGTKKNGSHTGSFEKLSGTAAVKGTDPAGLTLEVVIDVNSMKTDAEKLTAHLKSPDFFEVKRYPEAKFVSTGVKKSKTGYIVTGDLTMHGETKEISFPAEITVKNGELKLVADFKIDRSEWGITYGKGMVDDEVAVSIDVAAKK